MRSNFASLLNFMNSPTGPPCAFKKASTPSSLIAGSVVIDLYFLALCGIGRLVFARRRRSGFSNYNDALKSAGEYFLDAGKPRKGRFRKLAADDDANVTSLHDPPCPALPCSVTLSSSWASSR